MTNSVVAVSRSAEFEWRPSLGRSLAAAPAIGLAPAGFVILYGVRIGDPNLSAIALVAYVVGAALVCALIARTHVTVKAGRIVVHRVRTRSCSVHDIARLVVVPIAYPGLRTAAGVLTAIALDGSGQPLIKVSTRAWIPTQVTQFISTCDVPTVVRVAETLTPQQAIERWPGSYSPFSRWRGYVILVTTLAFIAAVVAAVTWAVWTAPSQ
jgi:hypothetical protein